MDPTMAHAITVMQKISSMVYALKADYMIQPSGHRVFGLLTLDNSRPQPIVGGLTGPYASIDSFVSDLRGHAGDYLPLAGSTAMLSFSQAGFPDMAFVSNHGTYAFFSELSNQERREVRNAISQILRGAQ